LLLDIGQPPTVPSRTRQCQILQPGCTACIHLRCRSSRLHANSDSSVNPWLSSEIRTPRSPSYSRQSIKPDSGRGLTPKPGTGSTFFFPPY
jgi:hypothetical protein